ncbi:2OG-Fe(II) oxygenase [Streptomyces longisporoflavus]|uniref:isopenicillin N synthase family dioxygenase n=1 Tax=Streptomyces longisporoflavus TaxID=28044 RepID=UPI00167E6B62|nr:isopenicillin N synthase family oxygenase [Streptomyces longisporoflavus]GGV58754.1 2OG-Fe(II) oxygenase [Streptomyces longisporoflavus]
MSATNSGATDEVTVVGGYVPVIDLSGTNTPAGRGSAARAIGAACETSGFFTVVGHGVAQELIDRMYETARAFFELPAEEKAKVAVAPGTNGFYAEAGCSCGEEEAPLDLNEVFVASVRGDDNTVPGNAGAVTLPWEAANQWPEAPEPFRAVWREYTTAMEELATDLIRLFALALGLDENYFDDKIDRQVSTISANYYYPLTIPPLPGQLRKGEHADWGNMTILYQDGGGGLQVEEKDRGWTDVPYTRGSFVVNLGDMMEFWSGGRWVSTRHRVVLPAEGKNQTRISIPFFHIPNPDAKIEPLLPVSDEATGERIRSASTPAEWFRERLAEVFG